MKTVFDPQVSRSSSGRSLSLDEEIGKPRGAAELPPPQPMTPVNRSPLPPAADSARVDQPPRRTKAQPRVR